MAAAVAAAVAVVVVEEAVVAVVAVIQQRSFLLIRAPIRYKMFPRISIGRKKARGNFLPILELGPA